MSEYKTNVELIIEAKHNNDIRALLFSYIVENDELNMTAREYELCAFDASQFKFYSTKHATIESALNALHQFNVDEYESSVYAEDDMSFV